MSNRQILGCWAILFLILAGLAVVGFGSARENSLVIARPSDAISLDSNQETTAPGAWVYGNIIEPLIVLNPDMELVPRLATSWEFISDTTLRFYLRKGVEFHDGTAFSAEAVKYTFDRALFGEPRANWASLGADPISEVKVIDDYTVDIITANPYGPILSTMAMVYTGIISPAAVEKYGDEYGRHPVGTGPFIFEEWRTRDRIVLVANENYWRGRPSLDKVIFRVIPEEGSRMLALRTGEVDVVLKPSPPELPAFEADLAFKLDETNGLRVFYLEFNLSQKPLDDVRVRHAIAYAIDKVSILDNILEGAAGPTITSLLAPGVFGYYGWDTEEMYPYNPEKAVSTLNEAGWTDEDGDGVLEKNGEDLVLSFMPAKGRYLKDIEIAEAIQAQLAEVGIQVKMDIFEWATAFGKSRSAELPYHLLSFGWVTTNADADYTLHSMFISELTPPTGWNSFRYSNAEVDRLVELGRVTVDQEARKQIYARAQAILAADLPFVPIYTTKELAVMSADVEGLRMHPVEYNIDLYPVHY
jgi:ABC-type transport system substrate-binding protein